MKSNKFILLLFAIILITNQLYASENIVINQELLAKYNNGWIFLTHNHVKNLVEIVESTEAVEILKKQFNNDFGFFKESFKWVKETNGDRGLSILAFNFTNCQSGYKKVDDKPVSLNPLNWSNNQIICMVYLTDMYLNGQIKILAFINEIKNNRFTNASIDNTVNAIINDPFIIDADKTKIRNLLEIKDINATHSPFSPLF